MGGRAKQDRESEDVVKQTPPAFFLFFYSLFFLLFYEGKELRQAGWCSENARFKHVTCCGLDLRPREIKGAKEFSRGGEVVFFVFFLNG